MAIKGDFCVNRPIHIIEDPKKPRQIFIENGDFYYKKDGNLVQIHGILMVKVYLPRESSAGLKNIPFL